MRLIPFVVFLAAALQIAIVTDRALAQAPSAAAMERSKAISADMDRLFQQGDVAGARERAADASKSFSAEGEAWLSASYTVAAAEYDVRMSNAARVELETYPRMGELLRVLDPVDSSRGDTLVELLMDAKGMLRQAAPQDELAALYEGRIRKTYGEGSEPDLAARLRAAFSIIQGNRTDEGYKRLRDSLLAAARTNHYAFTIANYMLAADRLHQVGLSAQADEVFAEGEKTRAMREDIKQRAGFYLAYAEFRVVVPREGTHFVPLFSQATDLFARYYGKESKELMHANDRLVVALTGIGQLGTAMNLGRGNYELAVKVLGPEDPLTWRLADNIAEVLRGLGSPARALEYDRMVLAKRLERYGKNHFNTLLSANNAARDYLDLADYGEALKHFELNREIAVALPNDPVLLAQAETWILYTKLISGAEKLNDKNIAAIDGVITDGSYPALLSLKAANLLADHFAQAGDAERRRQYLRQAYSIAVDEMGMSHPLTYGGRIALANAKAETDPAGAATDFAKLDQDLTPWISMQAGLSGNRDVGEATRALADDMLYAYARLAEKERSAVSSFADAIRRWPSLEDGKRDVLRKLARAVDPDDMVIRDMLDEAMRTSFTYREYFSAGPETEALGWTALERLRVLDDEINKRLVERYGFDQTVLDKPLPTPSELLKPDEALVQYFITRKWRTDRESADPLIDTRLYAIVSRKNLEPTIHNLGDPRDIISGSRTRQMVALRATRSGQGRGAVPIISVRETFAELNAKLMQPLENELTGATTVFVIPDGQLFAVPFSLLQDAKGNLLEDRFAIRLLTRPESLYSVTAEQTMANAGRAVLAGGIDYANGAEKGADALPGTLKEVQEIAGILRGDAFQVSTLTGGEVSETALRRDMEGAIIAHLATHGAYASAKTGGAAGVDALWQSDVILSRSGDRRAMKRDDGDGRLYAFELMSWNLSKLNLLVLSACETGRGEETFVGGLRGMPTAINIAGAKRSLLTLWPVADQGTADFMVRFYQFLAKGETYAEALRQTRRDAIDGKIPTARDPLVWAAFVMFEN